MTLHENKESLTAGMHISFWTDTVISPLPFEKLKENLNTDVVIVGGGIAGVTVAYCLLLTGKKVALVEDGFIGSGETGHTTAHLVNALDDRYYEIARIFGEKNARLAAESHTAAIDFIEKTVKKENIECDFERVDGYLFLHPSDKKESLEKELKACLDAGLNVELLDRVPGIMNENGPCLRFPDQAQFHPLLYLQGLCKAIEKMGGLIFTETHAKEISEKGIVTDEGFHIDAAHVVVATNTPVNDKVVMHLKQFPYRSYVIGALIPKDSLKKSLWWDTGDFDKDAEIAPYHYVRIHPFDEKNDILISGGEDHATGLAKSEGLPESLRYNKLERWTRDHFQIGDLIYKWSGQVMETMDGIAFIGRNPMDKENVYIVTGDSGNGMTHGTIAGMLITDLINGKQNEWEKLYDPSRVKVFKAGKTWLKEFIGGLFAYLKQSPKNADAVEISSIKKDTGKIVELQGQKFGAYRDADNCFHLVAAECTHLKCIVAWNNDEKSWDCPCHGSRFTYEGIVINGPANENLSYHREPQPEFLLHDQK